MSPSRRRSDVFYPRLGSMLVLEGSTSPSRRLRQYFHAILKELQRFDYLRGCLVGNFASEITDAKPALKKRVRNISTRRRAA